MSRMTDSQRSTGRRNGRVPSASASRQGTRASINGTPLAEMFARAGVSPFELTRDEVARATETRGITSRAFTEKFGGRWRAEWPKCNRIPGYQDFLRVDTTTQPFMPTAPGKPGFLLSIPTMDLSPQDDGHSFHVFSTHHTLLHYQGEYTRPRLLRVEFNDWNLLSNKVSVERLYDDLSVSNFGCSASIHGCHVLLILVAIQLWFVHSEHA
jgi:hypothetical protein